MTEKQRTVREIRDAASLIFWLKREGHWDGKEHAIRFWDDESEEGLDMILIYGPRRNEISDAISLLARALIPVVDEDGNSAGEVGSPNVLDAAIGLREMIGDLLGYDTEACWPSREQTAQIMLEETAWLEERSSEPEPSPDSEYLLDRVLRAMPEPSGSETTDANVELPARDDPATYEYVRKDVEANQMRGLLERLIAVRSCDELPEAAEVWSDVVDMLEVTSDE